MAATCATARRVPILIVALILGSCGGNAVGPTAIQSTAEISPAAKAYLDELVNVMQANSVNRKAIDWSSFRAQVLQAARSAQSIPETYDAITLALQLLGDRHSTYYFPRGGGRIMNPLSRGCNAGGPFVPSIPTLPPTLGYVRVPSTLAGGGESFAAGRLFAETLQNEIRKVDRPGLVGWLVDLRGNSGGSQWPMIAGISPVLGEGIVGYALDPNSSWEEAWDFRGGAFYLPGYPEFRYIDAPYRLIADHPNVAVLSDRTVASAGEAVVISFRARRLTRSFGTPSCGLTTGNEDYNLSDGAILALAVSVMADRTRTPYRDSIQPDETVTDPRQALERAIAWLESSATS
jgi:C-terminal processing protease CtpA/Prc